VVSLDTSFLVDLRKGTPAALLKARELEDSGEPKCVTSVAAAEFLVGAFRLGGAQLAKTRSLLSSLVLLDADLEACEEAGRMGAELHDRGEPVSATDLLIAAISKRHGQRLLTRDQVFARIPGVTLETY
jgi:predicted nucleic acid-binding protein